MSKHRVKRNSNALNRYLQTPANSTGVLSEKPEKLKISNPLEEFEKAETEKQKPFEIRASHLPEEKPREVQITETPQVEVEIPVAQMSMTEEKNMPLYCNYCDLQKQCPDGRGVIRKDQKELIICKRRAEFRGLVNDAGTNDRQGLLAYIHKLRSINAMRIGRMIYKEALQNTGADRNLSLLIDKQIDNAMSEYKLLMPADKGGTQNFSYHLTHIHNTVDAYNELPQDIKLYLLQMLKVKLGQAKNPASARTACNISNPNSTIEHTNNTDNLKQDAYIDSNTPPYTQGVARTQDAGSPNETNSLLIEGL